MQHSELTSVGGRTWTLLAATALAVLLASCAAPPPAKPLSKYVAPTSGPTAKLVMRGAVPMGEIYSVNTFDDSEKCAGYRLVGVGNTTRAPVSTTLAANVVTTVEFRVDKPARKQLCVMRWTFTPTAGKTYLVSGGSTVAGCRAMVFDMTDPESIKPEPAALRRNPTGSACLPIAQSKAITVAAAASSAGGESSADAVLREGLGTEELQGLIGK